MERNFNQSKKPWRISHILIGLVILGIGGYWLVQVLRHGLYVPNASNVSSVISSKPSAGEKAVPLNAVIEASLNPGHLVDPATLETTVRLFRASDLAPVAARITASSGANAIVLTPLDPLSPETKYDFEIHGAKDSEGADIVPYVMSFTTGDKRDDSLPKTALTP